MSHQHTNVRMQIQRSIIRSDRVCLVYQGLYHTVMFRMPLGSALLFLLPIQNPICFLSLCALRFYVLELLWRWNCGLCSLGSDAFLKALYPRFTCVCVQGIVCLFRASWYSTLWPFHTFPSVYLLIRLCCFHSIYLPSAHLLVPVCVCVQNWHTHSTSVFSVPWVNSSAASDGKEWFFLLELNTTVLQEIFPAFWGAIECLCSNSFTSPF